MRRLVTIGCGLALFATIITLASCGGADIGVRQLVAITVQPGTGQATEPGGTFAFSATGTFDQAPKTQNNLPVEWASSDSNVATIDATTGMATCLAEGGPISMTASAAGKGGTVHAAGTLACQVSPNPVVKLDPTELVFVCSIRLGGACGCTSTPTATLTNVGGATLAIDSISKDNVNDGLFSESDNCGTSVEAGQSCAITVSIHPKLVDPRYTDELKITDNAADNPQVVGLLAEVNCVP